MIAILNFLWSEFVKTNERRFNLLLQILITRWLVVCDLTRYLGQVTDLQVYFYSDHLRYTVVKHDFLTISVLQVCCAVTTEYGIPSDFVRKSTASLKIKISKSKIINKDNEAQIKSLQRRLFTIYIAVRIASSAYSGIPQLSQLPTSQTRSKILRLSVDFSNCSRE